MSFSCPSPFVLNTSLGLCVEPTPPGFTFVNGRFLRNCPVGMTMNDLGVCIRPVMTRRSFVSDASIQETVVAIGANSIEGSNAVVFGTYDPKAFDVTFVQSQAYNAPVTQVKTSEGSSSLFLVGQESLISDSVQLTGEVPLPALKTAVIKNNQTKQGVSTVFPSDQDSLPASIKKMYYASSGSKGQMYFLGSPSTKIFLSDYAADLYSEMTNIKLQFLPEAYSVEGMTNPYFVGSYPFPNVEDGDLQLTFFGAFQNGSDDANPTKNSTTTDPSDFGPTQVCPIKQYVAQTPIDPVPNIFQTITDATSRNFYRDTLQTSFGYVLAGYTGAKPNLQANAYAVRYLQPGQGLDYDNCTLKLVPQQPIVQTLQNIQLPYDSSASDIRVARFDIDVDSTGRPNTLYAFGSSGSSGTILSFISENYSYSGPYQFLMFIGLSDAPGNPSSVDPKIVQEGRIEDSNGIYILGSFIPFGNLDSIFNGFQDSLNEYLSNNNTDATIVRTQIGTTKLGLTFQTNPSSYHISLAFINVPEIPAMTSSANVLGFNISDTWISLQPGSPLNAPNVGNPEEAPSSIEYNGLSTDDTSTRGNGSTSVFRRAMPVSGPNGLMKGSKLDAWSYDPIGQALAFAIGDSSSVSTGLGSSQSNYKRTVYKYDSNLSGTSFTIPDNCIDLEFHLWGAGGSSDLNGTGGAGAYVSGHLDLAKFNQSNITLENALNVIIGTGGLATFGGGGSGSSLKGKGGGRSAIQLRNRDIVTAGGGGGSSGSGQGGAASASGQAESGLPSLNGGQGASKNAPGLGGIVYGDSRFKRAPDGAQFRGGSNSSTLYKSSFGAGGGGAGYFGGGSGAYLGNNSPNDVPTGSGGGSSYSENLLNAILISGTREVPPKVSLSSILGSIPSTVGAGGQRSNGGLGQDGLVIIVATTLEAPESASGLNSFANSNVGGSSFDLQVWASKPRAFSTFQDPALWGATEPQVDADWTSLFTQLTPLNRNAIQTIFSGLDGLVVLVQDANDSSQAVQLTWTYLNATSSASALLPLKTDSNSDPFGPLKYTSTDGLTSFTVPAMTRVNSIRPVSQNSKDILFVGDGARIITAPSTVGNSWQNPRFIMDASTNLPLSMNFVDSHYNDNDQAIDLVGQPQSLQMTTMHKTPWTPQFASFYEADEIVTEIVPFRSWSYNSNGSLIDYTNLFGPYTVNGVGPVLILQSNEWVPFKLPIWISRSSGGPTTVFAIKVYNSNDTEFSSILPNVDRVLINFFDFSPTETTIGDMASKLGDSLQAYLNFCKALVPALGSLVASVIVGPFGILSITFSGLELDVTFELDFLTQVNGESWAWQDLFQSTGTGAINEDQVAQALIASGTMLGFNGIVTMKTVKAQDAPVLYESSTEASASIELVPTTNQAGGPNGPLTPLSVALPVNSTFAGSIYHVYSPTVKLAAVDTTYQIVDVEFRNSRSMWPFGLVCAAGGPIASVVHTTQKNVSADSFLDQPVPGPGSKFWIDYVQNQDQLFYWSVADCTQPNIEWQKIGKVTLTNIRSPANILVSQDGGASYGYAESLLGAYYKNKNLPFASYFAQTGLDSFHIYKEDSISHACGPAKFISEQNQAAGSHIGLLNAAVAQFNDIKFVPYEAQYQDVIIPGLFIAVGQFLWELNALASATWDTSINTLYGVAWVSLDGLCWTTMPIVPKGTKADNFWQVFRFDNVDTINDNATIITDIGMYMISVSSIMNNAIGLFTNGPILDFKAAAGNPSQRIDAVPIGLSGPYAAVCTSRDATGTCIKCLRPTDNSPSAWPISIPQIIGAGGAIQPNFDTCISNVRGDLATSLPYSSVEAAVDAFAIAAYAGSDKNPKIAAYRQSFFAESLFGPSNNSLIICPKLTDVNQTPSAAGDEGLADLMQCALDNGLVDLGATYQNVNGPVVVRKAGTLQARYSEYEGGLNESAANAKTWTDSYVRESRWLTLVPYDAKLVDASNAGTRIALPDTCPSTLGLGGSTIASTLELGSLEAYPPTLSPNSRFSQDQVDSNGLRTIIYDKVTNQGAFPGLNGLPEDGPFFQNKSTISSSGAWAPGRAPYDRAVLANDDLQSDFEYANQGTKLVFNGSGDNSATQTKNPYLYRLSSFEFPFDSVAMRAGGTPAITIGRDPQVYEPGFGPLVNYNLKNFPGFARCEYSGPLQPWPANPLPEEGFGHWWIRPTTGQNGLVKVQNSVSVDAINGLYQTALGYGTLIFQQQLGFYSTTSDHQGYAWPNGLPSNSSVDQQSSTVELFVFDTETSLQPANQAIKYLQGAWTSYLPFQNSAPDGFNANDVRNAWAKLSLSTSTRAQRAMYSTANLLNLKLFNKPEARPTASNFLNNWKFLVGLNFFRPRNWAFSGLGSSQAYGFGLSQQSLRSDQPNIDGRFEFLIPDPYFAPLPTATSFGSRSDILGIRPDVNEQDLIATSLGFSSRPAALSFMETPVGSSASYAQNHVAFHYFSINQVNGTATLDLVINVTKYLSSFSTFQWTNLTLEGPYDPKNLSSLFDTYVCADPERQAINQLLMYNGDPRIGGPLNSFTWSDPASQTTRSLNSMNVQIPNFAVFQDSELLITLEISANALRKRAQGLPMVASDYTSAGLGYSLLRHRYVLTGFQATTWPQGSLSYSGALMSMNPNATNLMGIQASRTDCVTSLADPRGPNYGPSSNFLFANNVVNLSVSDYNVEPDNAGLFTSTGPALAQDLMAQTYPGASKYGSDEYGFGLRIDSNAVVPEVCSGAQARPTVSATTNADLPCDHGYVSMVRTIVDSHDRYTNSSTLKSVDAVPHVARLTYVTKYVPSTLQAYGVVVPYQRMRLMPYGTAQKIGDSQLQGIPASGPITEDSSHAFQCCPNPFRVRSLYLIEGIPVGPDTEEDESGLLELLGSSWLRPSQFGAVSGSLQGSNYFGAFNSKVFDLESPGFWGRMPLPLINGQGNAFFDASNMPIMSEIYSLGPKYPFAGYDGIWDNKDILVQQGTAQAVSFRASFSTLTDFQDASENVPAGISRYSNALSNPFTGQVRIGQMLLNLRDASLQGAAPNTAYMRFELGFQTSNSNLNRNYSRAFISMNDFFNLYVYGSSGAYTQIMNQAVPSGPILVTHAELASIFARAFNSWVAADSSISAYLSGPCATVTFDSLTDRPAFQFNFNTSCSMLRLFVPSPLSNWLGLRCIAPPMFNIINETTGLHYWAKYTHLFNSSIVNYEQNNWFQRLSSSHSNISNWYQANAYISPWEFIEIAAEMFGTMDPAQGPSCQSGNDNWDAGGGPPIPENWSFNKSQNVNNQTMYLGTYYLEMVHKCTFSSEPSVSMNPTNSTLANNTFFQGEDFGSINSFSSLGSGVVTYPFQAQGNKATTSPKYGNGWTSSWSFNGSTFSTSLSDRAGWTSGGWSDSSATPLYCLYYESHDGASQLNFIGRQGMAADESHSFSSSDYYLADISNVSWTTRLANSLPSATYPVNCVHWWGLVAPSESQAAILGSKYISAHHADCSLRTSFGSSWPTQTMPSAAKFMGSTGLPELLSSSQATNLSSCVFLDSAYVPALEVPCPYGGDGIISQLRGHTKPANYDSYTSYGGSFDVGSPSLGSGSPSSDKVAEISLNDAQRFNWLYATRETYGALVPLPGQEKFSGSISSPFQFSLKGLSSAVPKSGLAINTWVQNGPSAPASTSGPALGPSMAQSISDANGLAVFLVTESCFANVGPTSFNTGGLGQYNRMALWAFNYSDLFATGSSAQPWISSDRSSPSSLTGLKDSVVDSEAFLRAYIKGVPYYMDESYDGAQFSTLGRCLLIGPAQSYQDQPGLSSYSGLPLVATGTNPVVLIMCPASFSPQPGYSIGLNRVDTLENSFSNSLVYTFTEPYNQGQAPAGSTASFQTYSIAFTDPLGGPMWTFYGLDNNASVSTGKLSVKASRSTEVSGQASVQRKVYQNFDGQDNDVLALDIRQVYASQSLTISQESALDPYAPGVQSPAWLQSTVLSTFAFQYTTLENPDWNFPNSVNCPYLPLAGTWNGDRDALWAGDAVTGNRKITGAARQMIPNYDGLSLLAEWGPSGDFRIDEITEQGPGFTLYAVDRKCSIAPPLVLNASTQDLISLSEYNLRRPSTVFVLMCDQWRNTIRISKTLANSGSLLVGLDTQGVQVPSFTNGDGSAFVIDFVDCMGPSDYNETDAQNNDYYGVCSGTLRSTTIEGTIGLEKSKPARPSVGSSSSWLTTPWSQSSTANPSTEQVWSPFTGGSYWNTFKGPQNLEDQESDQNLVSFSPNLWYPTYRWALAPTDPNNVWPTSVATNSTLQQANYVMFACTDGTIRKLLMPPSGPNSASSTNPFPVVETTNINTFFNNDINAPGGTRAFSYTWPGRLYNLTWFANNWWCTADNASVWTTAPCHDGTLINDPALVSGFFSNVIKFRPLSADEGHPLNWLNNSWPANEPHKFNVMKIINVNGSLALFVGSVDGEYIVINQIGSGFNSSLPTDDYAVPWLFPNTETDPTKPQKTMLYVSDIAVINNSIVLGSSVLPRDPQTSASVLWYQGGPVELPLLSLSYSPSFNNGPSLLMTGQHNTWTASLESSNVISTQSTVDLQDIESSLDARQRLISFTNQTSQDAIGQPGSLDTWSGTNGGYALNTYENFSKRASGLKKISRVSTGATNDAGLVFFDHDVEPEPGEPDLSISTSSISSFYALQEDSLASNLGSVILSHQHRIEFDSLVSQTPDGSSATVKTFHQGGFDMDLYTQAFFVSSRNDMSQDSGSYGSGFSGLDFSLGLKPFKQSVNINELPFTDGTIKDNTGPWNSNYIRSYQNASGSGPMPMWNRSIAFSFDMSTLQGQLIDNSYAQAFAARVKKPINGPLQDYIDNISDDLNIFQSMNIVRAAAIPANINIVDFAFAESAQAVAFTLTGPFGPVAPIIALIDQSSGVTQLVKQLPNSFVASLEARFQGPSIIEWNPYELKWYAAGTGTNMPDYIAGTSANTRIQSEVLRPAGITEAIWKKAIWDTTDTVSGGSGYASNNVRLMLLSADASLGATTIDSENALEPVRFTQVFQVRLRDSKTNNIIIKPVSRLFSTISCISFSPSAVFIGGSQSATFSQDPNVFIASNGPQACFAWRSSISPSGDDTKANWSFQSLNVPGTITAAKFVGYAWYISTWDASANLVNGIAQGQSNLFFASINFTVVTLLDTWSGLNSSFKVTSIDSATPERTLCNAADGFEVDPLNPNACVKICPSGFKAFGDLCVQNCPLPFNETGVPNECQPDARAARTVSPTINGVTPLTGSVVSNITKNATTESTLSITNIIYYVFLSLILFLFAFSFLNRIMK